MAARAAALLVLGALALTGCETTAEKSARLERAAKAVAAHRQAAAKALTVTTPSRFVKVLGAELVHGTQRGANSAVVVEVRNDSSRPLRTVPIAVTVTDSAGHATYQNNEPGLETALVAIPAIGPHSTLTWVDDQASAGSGTRALARVGEAATPIGGPLPATSVKGLHSSEASGSPEVEGNVHNGSGVALHNLVVFVTATRGGRPVGAARAIVSELAANSSHGFATALVGSSRGAQLQASAPAPG
jgi:hypothetical protein